MSRITLTEENHTFTVPDTGRVVIRSGTTLRFDRTNDQGQRECGAWTRSKFPVKAGAVFARMDKDIVFEYLTMRDSIQRQIDTYRGNRWNDALVRDIITGYPVGDREAKSFGVDLTVYEAMVDELLTSVSVG